MTYPDPPVLLEQPGQFSCPRCGSGPGTVAQLLNMGQLGFPLAGRCNRCEHQYQISLGSPSTTATGVANVQGAVALTVTSGVGFALGQLVVVDSSSVDGGAEVVTVSSAGSSTSIPVANTPLRLTHTAGATVNTAVLSPLGPLT